MSEEKVLTKEMVQRRIPYPHELAEFTKLNDAAAEILSKYEDALVRLSLSGLTELSDAAAQSLGNYKGTKGLDLSGLTKISDTAAESLAKCKELDLSGLTKLSDTAAESLAKCKGELSLKGLTELSAAAAESLSKYKGGSLNLPGLTELSNSCAAALAKFKGSSLGLTGLTELSDTAAESLSKYKGASLNLSGLTELSDTAAESLSKYKGDSLDLSSLTELSDTAAESLSKYRGDSLDLSSLTELSDTAAESFSKYQGKVNLYGLTELINDSTVESLSKIDLDVIEGLQKLSFTALQKLNIHVCEDGAQILFENPKRTVTIGQPFDGTIAEMLLPFMDKLCINWIFEHTEILTLQNAQRLAENPRKTPWGLEIRDHHYSLITDEAACYLADQDVRSLDLSGLVYLSEESADFLAGFKGERKSSSDLPKVISLNGLMEISPAIARRLAKFDGDLILNRIHNLDLETAKEISNFKAQHLYLEGMGPKWTDLGELDENHFLYSDFLGIDQLYGEEVDKEIINAVYKFKGKLHAGF